MIARYTGRTEEYGGMLFVYDNYYSIDIQTFNRTVRIIVDRHIVLEYNLDVFGDIWEVKF